MSLHDPKISIGSTFFHHLKKMFLQQLQLQSLKTKKLINILHKSIAGFKRITQTSLSYPPLLYLLRKVKKTTKSTADTSCYFIYKRTSFHWQKKIIK